MQRPSRGAAPSPRTPTDIHPVIRRTAAPPAALDLLAEAQHGLDEAAALPAPEERYVRAHLAALRTAAAVLAARAALPPPRPRRRGAARGRNRGPGIRSAWESLPEVAPELAEWSALFAAGAPRRARAEAGLPGAASARQADELLQDASAFLRLAERILMEHPALPGPRAG